MKKALIPISLSNQRFSTEMVVPAIEALVEEYNHLSFLVADKLQVYNRAIAAFTKFHNDDERAIHTALVGEKRLVGTLEERKRWLDSVKIRLGESALKVRWNILSLDDISDAKTFAILRRLNILACVDKHFKADVEHAATHHAKRYAAEKRSIATELSYGYIMEELALSLRLRVHKHIFDEYYIGQTLVPALNLYAGDYLASHWELAGVTPYNAEFRFFELEKDNFGLPFWQKVLAQTRGQPA